MSWVKGRNVGGNGPGVGSQRPSCFFGSGCEWGEKGRESTSGGDIPERVFDLTSNRVRDVRVLISNSGPVLYSSDDHHDIILASGVHSHTEMLSASRTAATLIGAGDSLVEANIEDLQHLTLAHVG